MKAKLLGLMMLILSVSTGFSQSYEFNDLKTVVLKNFNSIDINHEIQGYYGFFEAEKKDRKNIHYVLKTFNSMMNEKLEVDIVRRKGTILKEAEFNGSHFCFLFYNPSLGEQEFVMYDLNGKETGSFKYEKGKVGVQIPMEGMVFDPSSKTLYPVAKKGFVIVELDRNKGVKASLVMLNNEGKKTWDRPASKTAEKSFDTYVVIGVNEDYIVCQSTSRVKGNKKEANFHVNIVSTQNGKTLGEIDWSDNAHVLMPFGARFDEDGESVLIFGEHYAKRADNVPNYKEKLGFFLGRYEIGGDKIGLYETNYEKDIKPYIPATEKSAKKQKMNIFMHDIVMTKDGNVYVIGEQYKKEVSGEGLALNAAGAVLSSLTGGGVSANGGAAAKVVLYDFMVFQFDSFLKLNKVTAVEKNKSNVYLPQGMGTMPVQYLGLYLKAYDEFDYQFTTVNSERTNFSFGFVSYDRKDKKAKYQAGSVTLNEDGEVVSRTVKITGKPDRFRILPSTPGYVALLEYYRKEKRLLLKQTELDLD